MPSHLIQDSLQRPVRDLRISVIDQCNFRCSYCMPAEVFGPEYAFLKQDQLLSPNELETLVKAYSHLGVKKIRITGGEPLLRKDLPEILERLSPIEGIEDIALTTNAWLLPQKAEILKKAGVQRLNISLDSMDETTFQQINGRQKSVAGVLKGIEAAQLAGLPLKVNMVVEKGLNDNHILDMASHFKQAGISLRFIEFMDVGNHNAWNMEKVVPSREIFKLLDEHFGLEALDPNYHGEVAQRYRYRDGSAEIGLISSVTQPFCQGCNRVRLSADGKIYTCLFAKEGTPIRELLRSGIGQHELIGFLAGMWSQRRDRYSEKRQELLSRKVQAPKVEMSYIGG